MKSLKLMLLSLLVFLNLISMTACWNYREIDKLAIVTGVAIDKGDDQKFKLTVEVIDFTGEKNTKAVSRTMTMEGKTIFDAARNAISISGKRLYWSHMKT
ncbi:MAG: Ger(x)C family spore germination protein, partial [Bacillota bacterium]|nr:Ger(x)C family spore germination protein [Bacillota bacterium]